MVSARTSAIGAAALVAASLPLAVYTPANAASANGGVYAVAPQWAGWCPGSKNKVTEVKWVNDKLGKSGGDSGDDIVWMPVVLNQNQSVSIHVRCKLTTPMGMSYSGVKPTRSGQTFWFRLNGTFKTN